MVLDDCRQNDEPDRQEMKILYRYVTKEILLYLLIVLSAVLTIYLTVDFVEKIDNFLEAGVPAVRCIIYLLFKLPFIIVQVAPVGFLLSILVAFGLMSKNREVTALRSCGIGKRLLLKPTLVLGVVFCVLAFAVAEMVVPIFMDNANQIWLTEVRKKNIFASKTNDIWMRTSNQIIHIVHYHPEDKSVSGITIFTFDDGFRLYKRIDATTGTYSSGKWELFEGVQQVFDQDTKADQLDYFKNMAADIDLNPEDLSQAAKRADEMGLAELYRYIKKVEGEGYSAVRYRVDYHGKIAAPFVYVFLSLLGTAIALRGKLREGMAVSIMYGLVVAFFYWVFNSFCISLGYAEMLPPVIAAWAANFVLFCVSEFLFLSTNL